MTYIPLSHQSRRLREETWRTIRDAAAPQSFEVRRMRRVVASPSLTLSTCAAPAPAAFPDDVITVREAPSFGLGMSIVTVYDGETPIPRHYILPSAEATDVNCARFRALVRGEALDAVTATTSRPKLLP